MPTSALKDCGKPQTWDRIISVEANTPNSTSEPFITDRHIPSGQTWILSRRKKLDKREVKYFTGNICTW